MCTVCRSKESAFKLYRQATQAHHLGDMNNTNVVAHMPSSILNDSAFSHQQVSNFKGRIQESMLKPIKFLGSCLLTCLVSSKW